MARSLAAEGRDVVLVSKDLPMRVKAASIGLAAEEYRAGLVIGVPAYHGATRTHRPGAETMAAGVRGVRLGLTGYGRPRPRTGVGVYVDFAATERDWRQYVDGWVRPA